MFSGSEKIDVVVPIYRGQHYIKGIISQLEVCLERMDGTIDIGLILVNDDPDDSFSRDYFSESIEVLAVETGRNEGIHGARVRGFSYCRGDYVVFLDQDDRLSSDYFKSQLKALGTADAVVCRAMNGERAFYDCDKRFEELTSACSMFSAGNGILSPGQVLMRREAVPRFWQENILRCNGADDWMLWLCMLREGRCFVCNQEILYEHTLGSGNYSGSTFRMYQSEKEMYEVLEGQSYLDVEPLMQLKQSIQNGIEVRLKELDRLKTVTDIYDLWMTANRGSNSVAQVLKHAGCHSVAIYGMGQMGMCLYREIGSGIEVKCFIDRNAAYLKADIPVYTLDEDIPQVDLVIIALAGRENKISEEVSLRLHIPAIGIEDLLQGLLMVGE